MWLVEEVAHHLLALRRVERLERERRAAVLALLGERRRRGELLGHVLQALQRELDRVVLQREQLRVLALQLGVRGLRARELLLQPCELPG